MDDKNLDLGELKSRDVGNLISKQLVELGKEEAKNESINGIVDYGNLPSKALPNLGKKVVVEELVKDGLTKY
jgi:hypothetical protein